ncbi:hypothetical protein RHGRI_019853 [Rhododendron griersonianum]|uniref:Uncharacterized protein n=1 Tax=Rhododendron griersonianum TaxID=479676 RepID=A0AAV6JE67_9ERIC|nr:hypothetical protein RHGRI_019853 [Rhododendron griersonianum]
MKAASVTDYLPLQTLLTIEEEDIELIAASLLKRASLFKDEDTEEIEEEDEDTDPHRVERSELVEGDHIYKWSTSTAYAHHGR